MRPSRGMGIVVLVLAGVSGCAGVPQRSRTSSPLEAPSASPPVQQSGWRGWWSRWRNPTPVPAPGPVTDLRIETSRRVGPEREIWPDRSQSGLSRLVPSVVKPRGDDGGPTLGSNDQRPSPTMTAAEANRAIASLARPRKGDELVLPVRIWRDPVDSDSTSRASRDSQPADDDQTPPSALPTPIPLPGPFMERFSTQAEAKTDEAAQGASADAFRAGDVGPPPLVDRAVDPESAPGLDSPDAALVSAAQVPPPPPVRPSPRATPSPAPTTATPPAAEPAKPETPAPAEPAKPEASAPAEPAKPEAPAAAEPKNDVAPPPAPLAEQNPEAASPTMTAAPAPAAAQPPSAQAPSPFVAASQTGLAPSPTFFAAAAPRQRDDSASHGWWFTKWMRPQNSEHQGPHQHQASVYPSPQGPVQMPPVLVPTSYYSSVSRPSAPTPTHQHAAPTAQQAFVLPTPQSPPPTSHVKKPCFVVTRLHDRLEQLRQWKHNHICKHIQSFKDALAGKNRCQACGGSGVAPVPSAQAQPSLQGSFTPAPQAQSQIQSPFRLGLLAEPSHVAEREQVVERVAAQGLDEAPKR